MCSQACLKEMEKFCKDSIRSLLIAKLTSQHQGNCLSIDNLLNQLTSSPSSLSSGQNPMQPHGPEIMVNNLATDVTSSPLPSSSFSSVPGQVSMIEMTISLFTEIITNLILVKSNQHQTSPCPQSSVKQQPASRPGKVKRRRRRKKQPAGQKRPHSLNSTEKLGDQLMLATSLNVNEGRVMEEVNGENIHSPDNLPVCNHSFSGTNSQPSFHGAIQPDTMTTMDNLSTGQPSYFPPSPSNPLVNTLSSLHNHCTLPNSHNGNKTNGEISKSCANRVVIVEDKSHGPAHLISNEKSDSSKKDTINISEPSETKDPDGCLEMTPCLDGENVKSKCKGSEPTKFDQSEFNNESQSELLPKPPSTSPSIDRDSEKSITTEKIGVSTGSHKRRRMFQGSNGRKEFNLSQNSRSPDKSDKDHGHSNKWERNRGNKNKVREDGRVSLHRRRRSKDTEKTYCTSSSKNRGREDGEGSKTPSRRERSNSSHTGTANGRPRRGSHQVKRPSRHESRSSSVSSTNSSSSSAGSSEYSDSSSSSHCPKSRCSRDSANSRSPARGPPIRRRGSSPGFRERRRITSHFDFRLFFFLCARKRPTPYHRESPSTDSSNSSSSSYSPSFKRKRTRSSRSSSPSSPKIKSSSSSSSSSSPFHYYLSKSRSPSP